MQLTSTAWLATVTVVMGVALAGAAIRFDRRWVRPLLECVVVAVVVVALAGLVISVTGAIPYHFPPSFYVWAGLPVFAAAVAVRAWRGWPAWRRALGVFSAIVAVVFAASTINAYYGYIPTVSALLGRVARDSLNVAGVAHLRDASAHARHLPAHGAVLEVKIPGVVSGFHARPAQVYLPPAWFAPHRRPLPVIVLLSGSPGSPIDWTRSAFADITADSFAHAHAGRAPVIVMPDVNGDWRGDTECVDRPGHRAETYLLTDVRNYMIKHFGVPKSRHAWALAGLSEGATCALTVALRHPADFVAFADFSGEITPSLGRRAQSMRLLYNNSPVEFAAHDPVTLLSTRHYNDFGAWFEVGTSDVGSLRAARTLAPLAYEAGAQTCEVERGGRHNFEFWGTSFRHALPWIAALEGLGHGDPSAACTAAGGVPAVPPLARSHRPLLSGF